MTFFVGQLITTFMKEELQAILNENDIEKRMLIVMAQLERDLVQKKLHKQKQDNFFKQIVQDRSGN